MAQAAEIHTLSPPDLVQIFYKPSSDGSHTFNSPEVPGMLVYHADLESAFNMLASMITELVQSETGTDVSYELDIDFGTFSKKIENGVQLSEMLLPPITAHIAA